MFDKTHEVFGSAIELFQDTIAPLLDPIIKSEFRNAESVIAFCEFFGPNSFAGSHVPEDIKGLKLFDINIHKKGILSPRDFVKTFGALPVSAEVVYEGNLNDTLIQNVRQNKMPVVLNEGVVCKGGSGHELWMAKIKTEMYLQKLKDVFAAKWEDYAE